MFASTARFLLAALAASSALAAPAIAEDRVVVELFTSQGCSSCPPADELIGELARRDDLVAFSLPVDYWDFLGWKDTLADPSFAERQRAYAANRGDSRVYTPQMVVNGIDHAVGSNRAEVEDRIGEARAALSGRHIEIAIAETADTIAIDVGTADRAADGKATVWLVQFTSAAPVKIGRGENTGRTVTYYNVVRKMTPIGMWHGGLASFELPKSELMSAEGDRCAILVQDMGTGPILGAAMIEPLDIAVGQ